MEMLLVVGEAAGLLEGGITSWDQTNIWAFTCVQVQMILEVAR
jgi:hypothetical protein